VSTQREAETLSVATWSGVSRSSDAAARVLAQIGRVTSIQLASCILATDIAACRDNLGYAACRAQRRGDSARCRGWGHGVPHDQECRGSTVKVRPSGTALYQGSRTAGALFDREPEVGGTA
jgi:hypothetical protein